MLRCQSCGKELPEGSKFCDACGSLVSEAPAANTYASNDASFNAAPANDGGIAAKFNLTDDMKKYIKFGGIAIAAIIVIVLLISIISSFGEPKTNHALYFKDGELWYSEKANAKGINEMADDISDYPRLSDDGEVLVYLEEDDSTLFWRNPNKPKKQPVEIKDEVSGFALTGDGKYVIMLSDGDLYEYSIKKGEEIKIENDSDPQYMNDDCYVYTEPKEVTRKDDDGDEYDTEAYNYYIKSFGKKKESAKEIVSKADELYAVDEEELKSFFYIEDGDLYYLNKVGKKAEKIDSDVSYVANTYTDGTAYYVKETEFDFTDYIDTDEELDEEERMVDSYELCYYDGKDKKTVTEHFYEVEAYGPVEKAAIVINVKDPSDIDEDAEYFDYSSIEEKTVMVVGNTICELKHDDAESFKFSENGSLVYYLADAKYDYSEYEDDFEDHNASIESDYESWKADLQDSYDSHMEWYDEGWEDNAYDSVEDYANSDDYWGDYYSSVEEYAEGNFETYYKSVEDYCEGEYINVSSSGATLYKAKIAKNSVKEADEINTDVKSYYLVDLEKGKTVAYIKDWDEKDGCGTLFVNKKEVDTDVEGIKNFMTDSKNFLYYKDYKDGECTVYLCKNGKKAVEVASDVSEAYFTDKGDILVLNDCNSKGEGTLSLFTGKKAKTIDDDVTSIIPDMSANRNW
ncbi:MAG: zinc ribbon domain-containing protein [Ruminococcaceae bacterium]|nr:zinc ribbon domain-containing protein [Oscillospiraceae bacterium]